MSKVLGDGDIHSHKPNTTRVLQSPNDNSQYILTSTGNKGSLCHLLFYGIMQQTKINLSDGVVIIKLHVKLNLLSIISEICCATSDVICPERFVWTILHFTCLLMMDKGSTIVELPNVIASSGHFFIFSAMSFFLSKS